MVATFDSSATTKTLLMNSYAINGGGHIDDISDFTKTADTIALERKMRLERFWKDTTQKYYFTKVSYVD